MSSVNPDIKIIENKSTSINCSQTVEEYTDKQDWRIKANANSGYSHAGLINNVAGKVIANYWLDSVYTQEESNAHREGAYHIHDLDSLAPYCSGWSLRNLLNEGFNGVDGRVSSRPPKHLREALGQMSNFLGILQSEWAGAQAFSSFDTYLAPYVFFDKLSFLDVKKAIKQFVYNLNVPARWGQSPFTNITLDIVPPTDLAKQQPNRDNVHIFFNIEDKELLFRAQQRDPKIESLEDMRYGHFQEEMSKIVMAYYEVMTEGDSHGQPFTFPIPTVNITEDFDWESEVSNKIFENSAKMGCSYFQNFVGTQWKYDENRNKIVNPDAYKPTDIRSMCCRLRLDLRELLKRGNGLFGSAELTGSIGVVTINMARLGYIHKNNFSSLYKDLDKLMDLAFSTLEKKRTFIQEMYNRGLYPYTSRYLPFLRNHFSTIGVNGINELIRNFSEDSLDITKTEGMKIASNLLDHMRTKIMEYQQISGNLYNLEATPAEGTTYRFAKEDKKRFPDIIQAGTKENNYYTNSSQLPADFTDDPFEALDLQNELQCKYTGGTAIHLYMNEKISSPEACKRFVKKVVENYQIPYLTITPVFSVCVEHGYLNGEQPECPKCSKPTNVWTRVMGYFRPVSSFNVGKKGEHKERKFFRESKIKE
jgi:ribonucleoside-triphosphate reductase (formate)